MRMHLKNKKRKLVLKRKIIIILIIILIFIIYLVSKNASYYYLNYSERKAKDIIDYATDSGITEDSLKLIKNKDLYKITKNTSGEIEMIDYDSYLVNLFLKNVSDNISNALRKGNNSKVAFYIPVGSIFKNPILNSKGPKIPVRMEAIGSVTTSIETKITEYGINNCLIEMYLHVESKQKVMLPVISETIVVENDFPISYKIIKGVVPTYYGDVISKSSGIVTTPIE